jgi:hypothetical protein
MSTGAAVVLLSNAGVGNGSDVVFSGGKAAFMAEATFGGGSVKLQIKLPQGTYFDVPSASLTAAGFYVTDLPAGTYRAVAATATAVYARLAVVPS